MSIEIWLVYVGTVAILIASPGPSQLLMVSISVTNGFRRSLATAAGDLSANVLQMTAAAFGLAAALSASLIAFTILKWAGVSYLLWLGLRQIRNSFRPVGLVAAAPGVSTRRLWMRGFVTSIANPKAVMFFAALFPQFISTEVVLWRQLPVLMLTFVVIDAVFLVLYGRAASWLVSKSRSATRRWLDRFTGGCMVGAAILLGFKHAPRPQ